MRNDVIKYFQGFLFILGKPGDSNIEFGQYIFPLDIFEAEPEIRFAFSEDFILGINLRSIKKGKKQEENDGDKFVLHRSQNQISHTGDEQSRNKIQESPGKKGESRSRKDENDRRQKQEIKRKMDKGKGRDFLPFFQ
jgi:hypothetical protein